MGLFVASVADAAPLSEEQVAQVKASLQQANENDNVVDSPALPTDLTADQAARALDQLWQVYRPFASNPELGELPPTVAELAKTARANGGIQPGTLAVGDHRMMYAALRREPAEANEAGRPLLICTHGGGANPKVPGPHAWPVNTREWQTQIQFAAQLYPSDGIYFVPRMADDRLGRWYHALNHDAFERVIQHAVAHWGVDPNRVYLLGISEGGYGTAILAPFMPDRFAAANAMAAGVGLGNPAANLKNLPYRTDVGEKDTMFSRVGLATAFHARLDELAKQNTGSYVHEINVQPGRGHGIDYRPGVAWMVKHERNPWPSELHWLAKQLDGRRRARHYWIQIDGKLADGLDSLIQATANKATNTITISAEQLQIEGDGGNPTHVKEGNITIKQPLAGVQLRVLLHDSLVDLDKPVTIKLNGKIVFQGKAARDASTQLRTLQTYGDPTMAASAEVSIDLSR